MEIFWNNIDHNDPEQKKGKNGLEMIIELQLFL
jgi:hypothetical protein